MTGVRLSDWSIGRGPLIGGHVSGASDRCSYTEVEGSMEGSELYSKEARPSSSVPRNYPDLRDHLAALDDKGLLRRVDRPINKDTEIHPLVRWQYRGGIEPEDRKAWFLVV